MYVITSIFVLEQLKNTIRAKSNLNFGRINYFFLQCNKSTNNFYKKKKKTKYIK